MGGREYVSRISVGDITIYEVTSDPNGSLAGAQGDLAVRSDVAGLYQNTDGATAWTKQDGPTYPGQSPQVPTVFADPGIVYNTAADWSGTVQARRTSDGRIHLRGVTTRAGSTGTGVPMFTLPVGFRPAVQQLLPVVNIQGGNALGAIQILSNGEVNMLIPTVTTNDPRGIVMDGISFSMF